MLNDKTVSPEEKQIVRYGLENMLNNLAGFVLMVLLGAYYACVFESILLWIFFFGLRKNAGGFHAKTRIRCLVSSTLMLLIAFKYILLSKWNMIIYVAILVIIGMLIWWLAPIENQNKILDKKEKAVYRRRTRIILLSQSAFYIFSWMLDMEQLCKVVVVNFVLVGISLILEQIKTKWFFHIKITGSSNKEGGSRV